MKNVMFGAFLCLSLICSLGTAHATGTPGTVKWAYATGGGINSSPAIGADGTIYVGSLDYKLYAINPGGTFKWAYAIASSADITPSTPAIGADGTIYAGSKDNKLYALNPNGTFKWSYTTGA